MKKKILIVEDNNDSRAILVLMLTSVGYQAIQAQNSKEAIACAEAEQPALIFMDMGLPDCDGINTSAVLKKNRKPHTFLSLRLRHGCPNYGGKKLRDWASKRIY